MPFLNDLVTQLTTESWGTLNSDIFTSTRTSIPVLASGFATLQLTATGGTDPINTHNDLLLPAYIRPTAQAMIRAGNAELAMTRAIAARNALYKIRNTTINGTWYQSVRLLGDLLDSGVDDRQQSRVSFNVMGTLRP